MPSLPTTRRPELGPRPRAKLWAATLSAALPLTAGLGSGCTSLQPQLHPTDIQALEQLEDREDREQALADNVINEVEDARGVRYVKGDRLGARPRGWQSLDLVLRSDRNSAAALPEKQIRAARVLTGLIVASAVVTVGGFTASAREGLDLSRLNGTGAIMLTGGVLTLGFAISAGVMWGKSRRGYERAIDIYNDSLGLRLGIYDAEGSYIPPAGVLVDEEGFIILDQRELITPGGSQTKPRPAPKLENPPLEFPQPQNPPAPQPAAQPEAAPAPQPGAETAAITPAAPTGEPSLVGPARGQTRL
ncbi:hypothetical protein G6O69_33530 [Pseudenhygromyxa sp. WMMC2535]|uniref:hypothetical protein n=1 Tax=Pseudenhygromyxa sp. WMMC2535 TaxID=2712867 RepID=UPI001595DE6B|nr:hypothetical protein [Pseudenhygromyxa sp. WMMC2535]NVB42792.1 hypothetical protein [Pseudenhygromyxa sp. WMMC2535]